MTAGRGPGWRKGRRAVATCGATICLAAGLAACGEQSPPAATLAVQSYLTALAEGNYGSACALIDGRTRRRVARSLGRRVSCPGVFHRCLPDKAQVPRHDQSQLLFADVQVSIHGRSATGIVGGTVVAAAIRRVSLAEEGRHWWLTSYGQGLHGCRAERRRARRSLRGRAVRHRQGASRSGA